MRDTLRFSKRSPLQIQPPLIPPPTSFVPLPENLTGVLDTLDAPSASKGGEPASQDLLCSQEERQPNAEPLRQPLADVAELTRSFKDALSALLVKPTRTGVAEASLAALRAANAAVGEIDAPTKLQLLLDQVKQLCDAATALDTGAQRMACRTRTHLQRLFVGQGRSTGIDEAAARAAPSDGAAFTVLLRRGSERAASKEATQTRASGLSTAAVALQALTAQLQGAQGSPALNLTDSDMAHVVRLAAQDGRDGERLVEGVLRAGIEGRVVFEGAHHKELREALRGEVGTRASLALALARCALVKGQPAFATLSPTAVSVARALSLDQLCHLLPACDSPLLAERLAEIVFMDHGLGTLE